MPGHALPKDCAASHKVKPWVKGRPTEAEGERLVPWGRRISLSSERICLANHMLLAGSKEVLTATLISIHSPPKLWCQPAVLILRK